MCDTRSQSELCRVFLRVLRVLDQQPTECFTVRRNFSLTDIRRACLEYVTEFEEVLSAATVFATCKLNFLF